MHGRSNIVRRNRLETMCSMDHFASETYQFVDIMLGFVLLGLLAPATLTVYLSLPAAIAGYVTCHCVWLTVLAGFGGASQCVGKKEHAEQSDSKEAWHFYSKLCQLQVACCLLIGGHRYCFSIGLNGYVIYFSLCPTVTQASRLWAHHTSSWTPWLEWIRARSHIFIYVRIYICISKFSTDPSPFPCHNKRKSNGSGQDSPIATQAMLIMWLAWEMIQDRREKCQSLKQWQANQVPGRLRGVAWQNSPKPMWWNRSNFGKTHQKSR